jgi:hypothetical protein
MELIVKVAELMAHPTVTEAVSLLEIHRDLQDMHAAMNQIETLARKYLDHFPEINKQEWLNT